MRANGSGGQRMIQAVTAGALLLTLTSGAAQAQKRKFIPAVELPSTPAIVVLVDGTELRGEVYQSTSWFRGVTKISIWEYDGQRRKLDARSIRELRLPVDSWLRSEMLADSTTTVEKAVRANYSAIAEIRELRYEGLLWPNPSKGALLQVVNPGFDSSIRVYALPNAKEGVYIHNGIALFGDEAKAFAVVKNGGVPFKVRKRRYGRSFEALFADCPSLLERFPAGDRKFRDFASHVGYYDRNCSRVGSEL